MSSIKLKHFITKDYLMYHLLNYSVILGLLLYYFIYVLTDWIFGQAPCLEIDGMKIVQSGSILRYLAKRYQLNGSNIEEETL